MRRRRIVWWTFGVALLGCVILAIVVVSKYEAELQPPYANSDGHYFMTINWAYDEDETEADKLFKGKVINLFESPGSPESEIRTDEAGEQYLPLFKHIHDSTRASRYEEGIRCYLYRPEDPVMERGPRPPGSLGYSIKGVCMGKIDGIVVMRRCYFVEITIEGPDW